MSKIELAFKVAQEAHAGQFRRDGKPYFTHAEAVYKKVKSVLIDDKYTGDDWKEDVCCAALAHDILEDTQLTSGKLCELGFSEIAIKMVEIVSKKEGETYLDFIVRILESYNIGAILIKYMDLGHNIEDRKKGEKVPDKYLFAQYLLKKFLSEEAAYLNIE